MVLTSQNRLLVVVQLLCGEGAEKDKAEQNGANLLDILTLCIQQSPPYMSMSPCRWIFNGLSSQRQHSQTLV